jgi:hypothetical protein
MASGEQPGEAVARRYAVLRPYFDERQRRLVLAAEAAELGRGGSRSWLWRRGWHCCIEAKSVPTMHRAGEADPSGTPKNHPHKPDI